MTTTWILSANRSNASLFESNWPGKSMRRLQDIPNHKGRLQNKDINTDKPGRSFDSMGQGRHSMGSDQEPISHVAQQYASELAELLNKGRLTNAYEKLVLIAEPKFLGILRAALDKNTALLVVQSVNKELLDLKEEDVGKYLQ